MLTSLPGAQCGTVAGEYCHPLWDKLVTWDAAGSSGKGSLQSITTLLKLPQQLSSHPDQTFAQKALSRVSAVTPGLDYYLRLNRGVDQTSSVGTRLCSVSNPQSVQVNIKASKTDSFRDVVMVYVGRTNKRFRR